MTKTDYSNVKSPPPTHIFLISTLLQRGGGGSTVINWPMPSIPFYHISNGGCGGSNGGFGDSDKGLSELVVAVT
jgi:hypothetical protein